MKVIFPVILNLVFLISSAQGHTVSKDHCAKEAFTEEVSNLKCDKKYIKFNSRGLPASSHVMMEGIEATNQQFPTIHEYQFKITRNPIKIFFLTTRRFSQRPDQPYVTFEASEPEVSNSLDLTLSTENSS